MESLEFYIDLSLTAAI